MNEQAKHFYTFGALVLDAAQHFLLRDGKPVSLARKARNPIGTLLFLICNSQTIR